MRFRVVIWYLENHVRIEHVAVAGVRTLRLIGVHSLSPTWQELLPYRDIKMRGSSMHVIRKCGVMEGMPK